MYQCSDAVSELEACMSDPKFRLDFAKSTNAGAITVHASAAILRHIGSKPQHYKIGFTKTPHSRFYKKYEGTLQYSKIYNFCIIVGVTEETSAAGMLEASLIHEFKRVRRVFYYGPCRPYETRFFKAPSSFMM